MASIMHCDSDHEERVVGHVLVQLLEDAEIQVFCADCFSEWLWGMVENLPDYDNRIKARMDVLIEQQQKKDSAAARRRRKAGLPETEPKDSEPDTAPVESTVTEQ